MTHNPDSGEIDSTGVAVSTFGSFVIAALHGVSDELTPPGGIRFGGPYGAAASVGLGVATGLSFQYSLIDAVVSGIVGGAIAGAARVRTHSQ